MADGHYTRGGPGLVKSVGQPELDSFTEKHVSRTFFRRVKWRVHPVIAIQHCHIVTSVRNGDAGSPALLNKLPSGTLAQPYRTATGVDTVLLVTTTVLPRISALAG